MPEKVARYHPAARRYRDDKGHHGVSRAQLSRAVRIVHVIATETERRGWSVTSSTSEDRDGSGADGRLNIEAGGHDFWLHLDEKGVKERGPWEEQVQRVRDIAARWGSHGGRDNPSGPYDAGATGEFGLHLGVKTAIGSSGATRSNWGDRASWQLRRTPATCLPRDRGPDRQGGPCRGGRADRGGEARRGGAKGGGGAGAPLAPAHGPGEIELGRDAARRSSALAGEGMARGRAPARVLRRDGGRPRRELRERRVARLARDLASRLEPLGEPPSRARAARGDTRGPPRAPARRMERRGARVRTALSAVSPWVRSLGRAARSWSVADDSTVAPPYSTSSRP